MWDASQLRPPSQEPRPPSRGRADAAEKRQKYFADLARRQHARESQELRERLSRRAESEMDQNDPRRSSPPRPATPPEVRQRREMAREREEQREEMERRKREMLKQPMTAADRERELVQARPHHTGPHTTAFAR